MKSLREVIAEKQKEKELYQKEKRNAESKKKLEVFKENGKTISKPFVRPEQPKLKEKVVELSKLTMDEIRAYYIVIVKKKPKHDSIYTKDFLIEEIIKSLVYAKLN